MKAVIFDMDGVLVNSEPIYFKQNIEFYKNIGADILPEDYKRYVGMSGPKMWAHIISNYQLPYTVEQLKESDFHFKMQALQEADLVAIDGVIEFLQHLKTKDYKLAIASSGRRKHIDYILDKISVTGFFDTIVSGGVISNGKPAPDIFLKAAELLQCKPNESAVIEDSFNGVCGAKAANMFCVGFYNPGSGNQDLSSADIIIDKFNDSRLYEIF